MDDKISNVTYFVFLQSTFRVCLTGLFPWILSYNCLVYSKIYVKRPHRNRQNKCLNENGSLMKVESIAEYSNTFDLHYR